MNSLKSIQGVTLIEIMIAMSLLAIVILPISSFFANSTTIVRKSDIRQKALLLAQQKMEKLKTVDYDHLDSREGTVSVQDTDYPAEGLTGYPEYSRKVKIIDTGINEKLVSVQISWGDKKKIILRTKRFN